MSNHCPVSKFAKAGIYLFLELFNLFIKLVLFDYEYYISITSDCMYVTTDLRNYNLREMGG
jgi:hypothetical protein